MVFCTLYACVDVAELAAGTWDRVLAENLWDRIAAEM